MVASRQYTTHAGPSPAGWACGCTATASFRVRLVVQRGEQVNFSADTDPADSHESQAAFARRLGVTRSRVNALIKAGLPIEGRKISVAEGLLWVEANIESRRGGANSAATTEIGKIDLVEARRLKILADTQMVRLQISREARDLVDRRSVALAMAGFSRLIRDKWINFGNRYGQQIAAVVGADPAHVMAEIDKAVRLHLDEVATATASMPMPEILNVPETGTAP